MTEENKEPANESESGLPQEPPKKKPPRRGLPGWPSCGCLTFGLVCLALLALFAADQLPGYVDGQTRAKVHSVMSSIRSLGTALEAYAADEGAYPPCTRPAPPTGVSAARKDAANAITTFALRPDGQEYLRSPKSYTEMPFDIFAPTPKTRFGYYTTGTSWVLFSAGPDRVYDLPDPSRQPTAPDGNLDPEQFVEVTYDPSNGINSTGDIFRFGGAAGK